MQKNYLPFVERMISRYEGGYGWDKGDAGGPTKYGITCFDLAEHRHQRMDSMARWAPIVRAMPLKEADDIYQTKYATSVDFNELQSGADTTIFDWGVNSGQSRAIKYAQQLVKVPADGVMGPVTLKAINDHEIKDFINRYCDMRMSYLRSLHNWTTFRGGWTARVKDLRFYSLALLEPPKMHFGFQAKEPLIAKAHAKSYDKEQVLEMHRAHGREEE